MPRWWMPREKKQLVKWIFKHYKGKYSVAYLNRKKKKELFGWYNSIRKGIENAQDNRKDIISSNDVVVCDGVQCSGSRAERTNADFQHTLW